MPPKAKKPAASAAQHKRMHSDVPDGPSKRVAKSPEYPRLKSEAKDILEHYSHEQLKALVVRLFGDPVTGPTVWRELSSLDEHIDGIPDGVLQEVRIAAKSECERIMQEAQDAASALADRAESLGSKSTVTLDDWPQALKDHLLDIKALMERGTMVYGLWAGIGMDGSAQRGGVCYL
ncbi:hypothetical protein LTR13_002353 [Exophiala sideris]|nr:hypothetical protein LTR13_002353 [Exophiala sideris]